MKSQSGLSDAIFLANLKIQEEFPELLKYLDEIPECFQSIFPKGINNIELEDYLESLSDLLKTYAKEHLKQHNENKNMNCRTQQTRSIKYIRQNFSR
jgi:hypothetical protein